MTVTLWSDSESRLKGRLSGKIWVMISIHNLHGEFKKTTQYPAVKQNKNLNAIFTWVCDRHSQVSQRQAATRVMTCRPVWSEPPRLKIARVESELENRRWQPMRSHALRLLVRVRRTKGFTRWMASGGLVECGGRGACQTDIMQARRGRGRQEGGDW